MKKITYLSILSSAFILLSIGVYYINSNTSDQAHNVLSKTQKNNEEVFSIKKDIKPTASLQRENEGIIELESEIAALKNQINSLAKNINNKEKIEPNQTVSENTQSDSVSQTESAISLDEELAIEYENNFNFLSAKLLSENIDKEWADDTITNIETAMESNIELAGIEVMQTTCMTTMCKIDLNIDQSKSVEEVMQRLSIHRPWQGQTSFVINRDGYAQIIFARDGYTLAEAGAP